MSKRLLGLLAAASACLMGLQANACSICRCGDPTFNALGNDGVPQTGFRLALDRDRLEKQQGSRATGDLEELEEERVTALVTYAVSDRIALFGRVPYTRRELTEAEDGGEKVTTSGLADPELYAQVRLWSSPFEGEVGQRASLFGVFGVKTDLGENRLRRDGERADEHSQPGTGSNDLFAGLAASYQVDPRSALFASFQYRSTGRNDFDYRYGNVWLANLAYEHKLRAGFDGVLELNYRHTDRDSIDRDSGLDDNTGGSIVFVTPRLLFSLGKGWVVRASAQIPLSQSSLNGAQDESTVVSLGITYLGKR
jgi:hypothetical protein